MKFRHIGQMTVPKDVFGPVSHDSGINQFTERRVICSSRRNSAGQFITGIQSQANDGDLFLMKQRNNSAANAHGILHGMFPVFSFLPQIIKRSITDDHGRINSNSIRFHVRQTHGSQKILIRVRSGQTGHHLKDQIKPLTADQICSFPDITCRMSPSGTEKNIIYHGLAAQLNSLNALFAKKTQVVQRDGIRSGGTPNRADPAGFSVWLHNGQKFFLNFLRYCRPLHRVPQRIPYPDGILPVPVHF